MLALPRHTPVIGDDVMVTVLSVRGNRYVSAWMRPIISRGTVKKSINSYNRKKHPLKWDSRLSSGNLHGLARIVFRLRLQAQYLPYFSEIYANDLRRYFWPLS